MPPTGEGPAMTPAPAQYADRCRAAVEAEGLPFLAPLVATSQGVPDFLKLTREYVKVTAPKAAALPVYDGPPPATLEEGIALMDEIGSKWSDLSEETDAAILALQAERIAAADEDQAPGISDAERSTAADEPAGISSLAIMELQGAVDRAVRDGLAPNVAALVAEYADSVGGPERVESIILEAKTAAKAERAERERQVQADAAGAAFKAADEATERAELEREAREILEKGDPITYHREAFAALHSGDQEIGDVWLMSAMTQAAVTTAGIQPGFSGKKGSGKSHGTRAALHLHPPEYVIDGSFSNKALLYDGGIPAGSIVYSDDTVLAIETASMVKRAMTGFQTGIEHRTVNKNGGRNTAERLKIPPRCLFAFSSVYDAGDDEIQDRQYLISLAPTPEDDKKWLDFLKERLAAGREEFPVTREVLVCREMIRQVKAHTFKVRIPFTDRITFAAPGAKRDVLMFFDFLQASAVLHHLKRKRETAPDGIITVDADEADFHIAAKIFQASEQTRAFKIGKAERALLQWIGEHSTPGEGIEETKVIREYGEKFKVNRASIRRLLYGRDGNGGIVNKVPGVDKVAETRHTAGGKSVKNIIYVDSMAAAAVSLGEFAAFVELRPPRKGDPSDPGVIRH